MSCQETIQVGPVLVPCGFSGLHSTHSWTGMANDQEVSIRWQSKKPAPKDILAWTQNPTRCDSWHRGFRCLQPINHPGLHRNPKLGYWGLAMTAN